jgi:hypothetical protein
LTSVDELLVAERKNILNKKNKINKNIRLK